MSKIELALTYDDLQLVPDFSNINSRTDVSLRTHVSKRYGIMIPIVASPMDTVCDEKMAWKLYTLGGAGVIHRFMTIQEQVEQVQSVYERIYRTSEGLDILELMWGVMYDDWHAEIKYPPIMAAIGVQPSDRQRAKHLVEAGANVLVIDVAHGHHQKVIDMIKWCKSELKDTVDIVAGNVATANAVLELEEAGVDGVRINIGNGALCTTRLKTGFGVPSVTSLLNITRVATVPIMADGGIRNSGDIAKALALGADTVMAGSLLAGTDESPGNIIETPQGLYKQYRGSASLSAKLDHSGDGNNVEGESTMIPYKGGVKFIINGLTDGIKSALSYGGASNLQEFNPEYVQVTNAGMVEAKPHLI